MKHILVKLPGTIPHLQPAVATGIHDSGMLVLESVINWPDGDTAGHTDIIPLEYCYEFDADLMDQVNRLTGRAGDAIQAANQILDHDGIPVNLDDIQEGGFKTRAN